jgi:UDP-N-acetylmuramoyl-tripeptide--D-alanyl-D-alanine ligase
MAIIEMGANHQKEIDSYCRIAEPTHGLITNCGKAHLEGFGGVEGIRKGKGELFDWLRAHGGTAFIMADYDYLHNMSTGIREIVTYGTTNADTVGQLAASHPFLSVTFSKPHTGTVNTSLVGGYNLSNVLAAVSIGHYFKVPYAEMKKAIGAYQPSNSRSQMVTKGTTKIIMDAYNANPSSMKLAIENFAQGPGNGKILVLGAMAELGDESLQEHQALIDELKKHNWKEVLLVGGDFEKLDHPYRQMASADEAGRWLQQQSLDSAFLLLKGSRSMQIEKVLTYLNGQ